MGIGIYNFADNVKAHGIGEGTARSTPFLGDYIAFTEELDEATNEYLGKLNEASRKAHEKAKAQTKSWLQYELSQRKTMYVDVEAVAAAARKFYDLLQIKYYLELTIGRAANINDIAKQFQKDLDKATSEESNDTAN